MEDKHEPILQLGVTKWRLDKWNAHFSDNDKVENVPMSKEEIRKAACFLRENNYPKPEDCSFKKCQVFRSACRLGICRIAIGMCGDF